MNNHPVLDLSLTVRQKALINEYKGALFEFFFAREIAKLFAIEEKFYRTLSAELSNRLKFYEKELVRLDNNLLSGIYELAQNVCKSKELIKRVEGLNVENVFLTGKEVESSGSEDDITLVEADGRRVPLSLKLIKENSFVNTKSGGVKSFITQYFSAFDMAKEYQEGLNLFLHQSFDTLAYQMCEQAGIEYHGDFSRDWKASGLSDLPGELPDDYKKTLYSFYGKLSNEIQEYLKKFHESDREKFVNCLWPLQGLSLPEMIQCKCEYRSKNNKISLNKVIIKMRENIDDVSFLLGTGSSQTSFLINLYSSQLQIRIKPMNKFTVPGFKINCSVKESVV